MADQGEWTVLTRTRGGTVSLLKNLTEEEARGVMQRLRRPHDEGNPWDLAVRRGREIRRREAERRGQAFWFAEGGSHSCSDGDLAQIDCWGPPGAKLEVWPKPPDWDVQWAAVLAELDAEDAAREPEPPKEPAPPAPKAADYGLPAVLSISSEEERMWRCATCNKMQDGGVGVWIPDSIMRRDTREEVEKVAKQQRWNGHSSLWCMECCAPWRAGNEPPRKKVWPLLSAR